MANENLSSLKGIDYEFENRQSCNKLLTAVLNGDEKTVKKLLRNNWSPNTADNLGRTGLHLAARSSGLYNILKLLLDSGGYTEHVTHSGATPLCLAAYGGLEKTVSLLLERGASISVKNNIDATPLHFACNGSSVEVVRLLVEAGAPVNAADFYRVTPLMLAVKNKQYNIVRYLLENGADLTMKESDGRTAFHYLCNNDDLEMLNILIKRVDISSDVGNISDPEGWTLLMHAAQIGAVNVTDRLLELGSDTSKRNHTGLMALHLAAHNSAGCFRSILNKTPVEVINANCIYSPEPNSNSLPCLLIDKFFLESLKLLFNKKGIDDKVLTCPIVKQNRIFPPLPFSFFSESSSDFASKVVQLYVDKGIPLDPVFTSTADTVTCLESLMTSHIFHTDPLHHEFKACNCARLFVTLLENGASPDPYTIPEDLHSNNVLWFVCINGSTFGLAHLLRYSNFLEPHRVLRFFTSLILDTNLYGNSELSTKTIQFLCRYSRPWDISECKQLMSSVCFTHPDIARIAASYHRKTCPFPSLKFLCRAALREEQHWSVLPDTKCKFSPLDYSAEAAEAFRRFVTDTSLPKSLLLYLQYEDMITTVRSHPCYPSFDF